jgi:hypothetical protein
MLGDYVPRQDLNIKDARLKELDEMTDDELIRLAGSMGKDGGQETGDGDSGLRG